MISLQLFRGLGMYGNVAHEILVRDDGHPGRVSWRRWLWHWHLLGSTSFFGPGFWFGLSLGTTPALGCWCLNDMCLHDRCLLLLLLIRLDGLDFSKLNNLLIHV